MRYQTINKCTDLSVEEKEKTGVLGACPILAIGKRNSSDDRTHTKKKLGRPGGRIGGAKKKYNIIWYVSTSTPV